MWVGASYFSIGEHPVILVQFSLFGWKQRQDGSHGVQREIIVPWENNVFSLNQKIVPYPVAAYHGFVRRHDLNSQIVQGEFVVHMLSPHCFFD
jgi:hypothetical protein